MNIICKKRLQILAVKTLLFDLPTYLDYLGLLGFPNNPLNYTYEQWKSFSEKTANLLLNADWLA